MTKKVKPNIADLTVSAEEKYVPLHLGDAQRIVKSLQGKVLTQLEVAFTNKQQLNAIKAVINQDFSRHLDYIVSLCYPELPIYTKEQMEISNGLDIEQIESEAEEVE